MNVGGLIFLAVIALSCHCILGAPRRPFGPKVGMDFMHGVLMHGDEEAGDSHQKQDEYERLQNMDKDKAKAAATKDGPCEGMDCLHGVLMHGDDAQGVKHMEQKPGPQQDTPGPAGPCEGMDCLHGVMMHGDEQLGKKHVSKDEKLTHVKIEMSGQKDPEHLLHGAGAAGHDKPAESQHDGKKSSAGDPEHLLHGGNEAAHDPSKVTAKEEPRPSSVGLDPEGQLHAEGGVHAHGGSLEEAASRGSRPVNGKDPDERVASEQEGGGARIGTISTDEAKDYRKWKDEKSSTEDDGGFLGFSFPFVSDSILDEIDTLKRRYLAKFWPDEKSKAEAAAERESTTTESPTSTHYDINGDMRHELEAIGNTDAIRQHSHESTKKDNKGRERKDL